MKRFLSAGEGYALPQSKINLYATSVIIRQKRVIAVFLSLLCLWIQDGRANDTAPQEPSTGAVFSSVHHLHSQVIQQHQITGTVVDQDGRPIEGVTVSVRGGGAAATTSTDVDGRFTLLAPPSGPKTLVATFVGFQRLEKRFETGDAGPFELMMIPTQEALEEVEINAGYYNTTKRMSTGNIAKVDAATIARQPVTNPLQALNGQVSGVRMLQSHGLPGSPISIEIRGRNSIRSGNEPLYIVDGVPYGVESIAGVTNFEGVSPMNSINPNDIESISILKDADATAIYGSRGANGVVLITTKRAKSSRTALDLEVARGFGSPTRLLEPLSTEQYLQVRRDAFANSGIEPTAANAPDLTVWDPNVDNKMQDWLVGNTLDRWTSALSLTGGAVQTLFKLSGNYHQENSIFDKDDLFRRGNVHFNLSQRLWDDKVQLDFTTLYSRSDNSISGFGTSHLNNVAPFIPNYPLYDDKGDYNWTAGKANYIALSHAGWESQTNNFNANLRVHYNVSPVLKLNVNGGYNRIANSSQIPQPRITKNPATASLGNNTFTESAIEALLLEPQLDYKVSWGKSHIEALVGSALHSIVDDRNTTILRDYINDLLINSRGGGMVTSARSSHSEYRYISMFTRLHYDWRERYILNLTARRDGSSRFGPGKRFGTFGSIGAAWLFAEESVLRDYLPWLSMGKLRGSYGTSGNDNIGDYAYLSLYNNVTDYGNQKAIAPNQLANDNYRWEVNRKLEVATEIGFWNDRVSMDVAWYRNRSDNQLISYPLPATSGFTSYTANMPALVQNQGWEVDMRIRAVEKKSFNWTASLNWTRHRNKLLEFPNIEATSYAGSLVIGESLSSLLRYRFIEVDPQTGLTVIEDVNGDGIYTGRSSYNNQGGDLIVAGNFDPKWSGGITNSIQWKNIQLGFSFHYMKQSGYNIFIYGTGMNGFGQLNNYWTPYLDYWKQPGDVGKLPKPFATSNSSLSHFHGSDQVFGDASFLRLNNVSLSYSLNDWTIYAHGQNLVTWTNYQGYDPESVMSNSLRFPPLRMLALGIRTRFR